MDSSWSGADALRRQAAELKSTLASLGWDLLVAQNGRWRARRRKRPRDQVNDVDAATAKELLAEVKRLSEPAKPVLP